MQSEFGSRIRPEEVTPETRRRIARASYAREFFALSCVFVPTIAICLMVSLGYRWHGEPPYAEWQPISPVLITTFAVMIGIHIWFHRERAFVKKAPIAVGIVKQMETSYNLTHTHRLVLKYKPLPKDPKGARLDGGMDSQLVTVAIESELEGFHNDLHEGDAVALLYDPAQPDHVRVIEEEHSR